MKKLILAASLLVLAGANANANVSASEIFSTPAMAAICAETATPLPGRPNGWFLQRPSHALAENAMYSTLQARATSDGKFVILKTKMDAPAQAAEFARFKEPVQDLVYSNGKLYVLLPESLATLDAVSGRVLRKDATHRRGALPDSNYRAHSLALLGDKLVIAHGVQGVAVYDLKAQAITFAHPLGLENGNKVSKAISISSINDNEALIAVENLTMSDRGAGSFNGLIKINLKGSDFAEAYPYNEKASGALSNARLFVSNGTAYINNWGILQSATLASMQERMEVFVTWTPLKTDLNGQQAYTEMMGDVFVENGQLVSCSVAQYYDMAQKKPIRKGLVLRVSVP